MNSNSPLPVGTVAVDESGYVGTVVAITYHGGSFWYDFRIPAGTTVRYPGELTVKS